MYHDVRNSGFLKSPISYENWWKEIWFLSKIIHIMSSVLYVLIVKRMFPYKSDITNFRLFGSAFHVAVLTTNIDNSTAI